MSGFLHWLTGASLGGAFALTACSHASDEAPQSLPGLEANSSNVQAMAPVQRLVLKSDRILLGHVIDTHTFAAGPAEEPGIHTRIRVSVERTVLGAPESFVDVWMSGGVLGDRARVVSHQPQFAPGEDVLLFLRTHGGALRLAAGEASKWSKQADGIHVTPAISAGSAKPLALGDIERTVRETRGP